MEDLKNLSRNKHLIGELKKDKNGEYRIVNGKRIGQIEEKTQGDIDCNMAINLWRMRNVT